MFICFQFSYFVATLVDPYNKLLAAVIVGAVIIELVLPVILPELIVPVVILLVEVKVDCFPFTFVSIELILFATLVPTPYNKVVPLTCDPSLVGKFKVVEAATVIFLEFIVPVVILLVVVNVFCFVSNWYWVIPPLEEILLLT